MAKTVKNKKTSLSKLVTVFLVVESSKEEQYNNILQEYQVNACFSIYAEGTAPGELGFSHGQKRVIIAVCLESRAKELLNKLDEKFKTIRGGRGLAFTVPFKSMIGVQAYKFFADAR